MICFLLRAHFPHTAGEGAKKCTVTKMIFNCTSEAKDIELDLTGRLLRGSVVHTLAPPTPGS